MRHDTWHRAAGWFCLLSLLAISTAAVRAEDETVPPGTPAQAEDREGGRPRLGRYWLGIECKILEAEDREKLNVPGEGGLLVHDLVPGGPAEKAGVKSGDVLLSAGEVELARPRDVIAAVEAAAENPLVLQVWRNGERVTLSATPAVRPRPGRPLLEQGSQVWNELQRMFEENVDEDVLRALPEGRIELPGGRSIDLGRIARGLRMGPGAVVHEPMPDDLKITVERKGREPARIKVERGDKTWEATEENLDPIPEDVRPHVAQMLGRGGPQLAHDVERVVEEIRARAVQPVVPGRPVPPLPPLPLDGQAVSRIEERVRAAVGERMEALQGRLEQLAQHRAEAEEHLRRAEEMLRRREAELEESIHRLSKEKSVELQKLLDNKTLQIQQMLDAQTAKIEALIERLTKDTSEDKL